MPLSVEDFRNWLSGAHQYTGGKKGYDEDGRLRLSATDLCKSPQEIRLTLANWDQLPKRSFNDSFRANMGTLIHSEFEQYFKTHYPHAICEERREIEFTTLKGTKVVLTGQVDMIYEGQLYDLKTRSTYGFKRDHHFAIQGAIYRHLLFPDLLTHEDMILVNLWHNWKESDDGPESPITLEHVKLMDKEDTILFLENWVDNLLEGRGRCSDQDRWLGDTTYALQKAGSNRAFRVFKTKADASAALLKHPNYQLVERPGEPRKCLGFCQVAQFCPQFNPITNGVIPNGSGSSNPIKL